MNNLFAALVVAVVLLVSGSAWGAFLTAVLILVGAAIALLLGKTRTYRMLAVIGVVSLLVALTSVYHDTAIPNQWYGRNVSAEGVVVGHSTDYFDLKVTAVENCRLAAPLRIRVYTQELPEVGSKVVCGLNLFRAAGASNPGQFDYQAYLKHNGIAALASCQSWQVCGRQWWFAWTVEAKSRILHRARALLQQPYWGMYAAMVVGDKSHLTQDVRDSFAAAGLSHLLVVSGLHVGMICGLLLWVLVVLLRFPLKAAYIVVFVVLFFYTGLVGFQLSALRAVLLIIMALAAKAWYKSFDMLSSLSAAALMLLLWQPHIVYSLSFQLSFAATAALVWLYPAITAPRASSLQKAVTAALAVQLVTVPIIINSFNYLSLYAILANIPAIPLAFAGLVCGLLLLVPGLGAAAALVLKVVLGVLYHLADFCASLPYAQYAAPSWPVWVVLLYYTLLAAAVVTPGRLRRWSVRLAVLLLITAVFVGGTFNERLLRVTYLDVGHGDCAVVELPDRRVIIVDTGEPNAAASITSYLRSRGVNSIEAVFISHGHSDHFGGAQQVGSTFDIEKFYVAGQLLKTDDPDVIALTEVWEQQPGLVTVNGGERLQFGPGCYIDVLAPPDGWLPALVGENNCSLVLQLVYGQIRFLFTGDIEAASESYLCDHLALRLQSQVLKVAHHGSASSSSARFLEYVKPRYAVISVGYNSFGHPSPLVVERLRRYAHVYRTDKHGAVTVLTDGYTIRINTFKHPR